MKEEKFQFCERQPKESVSVEVGVGRDLVRETGQENSSQPSI